MTESDVSGGELIVFDRGEGHSILFVHGFPLNHSMWLSQLEPLATGYRVIAPDLRGFGRSGVTPGTVTMQQFAADLDSLLDVLNIPEPVTLCGLSMGGYIAFQFVQQYRDRLQSLILCDTRAAADAPEAAQARLELAEAVLAEGPEPVVEAMLPKLFAESTVKDQPSVVEQVRNMIATTEPAGIAAALRGMAERPDSTGLLAMLDLPVLLLCGEEDRLTTPEVMRGMAEKIPDSTFAEIPNAGHMAPMENPEAVNRIIREFLDRPD